MKTKQLFIIFIGMIFVSCDPKDEQKPEKKLLPAKEIITFEGTDDTYSREFIYVQNYLIEFDSWGYLVHVIYNTDNQPMVVSHYDEYNDITYFETIHYVDDLVLIKQEGIRSFEDKTDTFLLVDTLTIIDEQIKRFSSLSIINGQTEHHVFSPPVYNSDGNIIDFNNTKYVYSDVKTIFRHVNTPDWFIWLYVYHNFFPWSYMSSKNGYMVSQMTFDGGSMGTDSSQYYYPHTETFAYTVNADGYVDKCQKTAITYQTTPTTSKCRTPHPRNFTEHHYLYRQSKPIPKDVVTNHVATAKYEYIPVK